MISDAIARASQTIQEGGNIDLQAKQRAVPTASPGKVMNQTIGSVVKPKAPRSRIAASMGLV